MGEWFSHWRDNGVYISIVEKVGGNLHCQTGVQPGT